MTVSRAALAPVRQPYEVRMRECLATITDPIWSTASDAEIGEKHGLAAETVREMRDQLRRDVLTLDVLWLALELQAVSGWKGSRDELIKTALRSCIKRARRRQDEDQGRSAGRVETRSRVPAQASEGACGDKVPQTTATARSRGSHERTGEGQPPLVERRGARARHGADR